MEFKTQYTRTPSVKETGGGKVITERDGYIPNKIRIQNMILAGQRLADYRKEKYDFEDGTEIDETYTDPTRKLSFDMADGTQLGMEAHQRLKDSEERQKALREEQKKKTIKDKGEENENS